MSLQEIQKPRAILGVDYLIPTNNYIDQMHVDFLMRLINSGRLNPLEDPSLLVRVEVGKGYYIVDGNHHYEAYKRVGITSALSELYIPSQPR